VAPPAVTAIPLTTPLLTVAVAVAWLLPTRMPVTRPFASVSTVPVAPTPLGSLIVTVGTGTSGIAMPVTIVGGAIVITGRT